MKLSVVACTYNGAPFLQPQLESLLAQTRLPDEIVVGDDASTDATWEMLEHFRRIAVEQGVRVHLWRQPVNRGYVGNFADTLPRSQGDVLFLCDQDDIWRPDKLALMADRFERDKALTFLCSDARLVDTSGADMGCNLSGALNLSVQERRAIGQGEAFSVLLRRSMATGATCAFRKELLASALPVGEGWIHDEWLAIVAAATGRVDFVDEALVDYRQHGANQVGMRKRGLSDQWRDLVAARQQYFLAQLQRQDALSRRLQRLDVYPGLQREIVAMRDYLARRLAVGRLSRPWRLASILREQVSGGYVRFGTGLRSALRDFLRAD